MAENFVMVIISCHFSPGIRVSKFRPLNTLLEGTYSHSFSRLGSQASILQEVSIIFILVLAGVA